VALPRVEHEIDRLAELAEERGAKVRPISADMIVVSEWVRYKCRYGCKGYAKHFSCPPYAPTPDETRNMLRDYETALLLRFDGIPGIEEFSTDEIPEDFHPWYKDMILWIHDTVHFIEKRAFYDGFYKAFGFGAYPCIYCEHCVAEESEGLVDESLKRLCRHMDMVRPSMEACGMDVFATAKNAGWELTTIPCRDMEYGKIVHPNIVSIGLVLLE
jgi:predicted metal-binding protein